MKKHLLSLFLIGITSLISAQIKTSPTTTEVIVYMRGAQIQAKATANLTPGTNTVIINNLPQYITEDNIQIKGLGDFMIQSVVKKNNYMNGANTNSRSKALNDSLKYLKNSLQLAEGTSTILNQQIDILMANKTIGGKNNTVSIQEIESLTVYMEKKLTSIQKKKIETTDKIELLNKNIRRVQQQLNEENYKEQNNSSELHVNITSNKKQIGQFELSYFIRNAGWVPYYDIRSEGINSELNVIYKAQVWQNTGTNWDKVKLSLSTGNPTQNGTQPTINPWWVSLRSPNYYKKTSRSVSYNDDLEVMPMKAMDKNFEVKSKIRSRNDIVKVNESMTNLTFDISVPYTIPSDEKKYSVAIQEYKVNANYNYYAAPRLDKDAFLMASVTDWEKLKLISANANIYFEDMFVGKTYLNAENTSDTLKISLGRDKNISIERTQIKGKNSRRTIGADKIELFDYQIVIKNKKNQNIDIIIEDQLPITQNKSLRIELLKKDGAEYRISQGKLTWNLNIKAKNSKKLQFSYSLKYPKDKIVK